MSIWENRRKLLMSGAIGRVAVRRLMGINVEDEAEVISPAAEAPGKRENMPTKPLQGRAYGTQLRKHNCSQP
jgi:hypothetical protein